MLGYDDKKPHHIYTSKQTYELGWIKTIFTL